MIPARIGSAFRFSSTTKCVANCRNFLAKDFANLQCSNVSTSPSSPSLFKRFLKFNGDARSSKTTRERNIAFAAVGATIGLVGAYSYFETKKGLGKLETASTIDNSSSDAAVIPDAKPTRRIRGAADNGKLKLILYQYQSCPFCCKVRVYLDFKGLSYDVVEVNSVNKREIKWSKYKKVPILVCEVDGERISLNDSSVIVSCLETYFEVQNNSLDTISHFYPSFETVNSKGKKVQEFPNKYFIMYGENKVVPSGKDEVHTWREWTDKVLVHTISPNIYRTPMESYKTFKYFSKVGEWETIFSRFECNLIIWVGAAVMYFVGKTLKRRHNISDDVRQSLYNAVTEWQNHVASKDGAKFAGGAKPNLADLSVYGILSAMEGTEAFSDILSHTKISSWFHAIKQEVSTRAGERIAPGDMDKGKIVNKI